MAQKTEIEVNGEAEATESKKKKKSTKKKKSDQVSFEECQVKLARIFNGVCTILGMQTRYSEEDFQEEAKDLSRLASKYDTVNQILTLLDPLFLIMGLINRASTIIQERRQQKHERGEEGTDSNDKMHSDTDGEGNLQQPSAVNY